MMKAIEVMGTIDEQHQLRLDSTLPIAGPRRVWVIIFFPEESEEWDESQWLRAGATNPAFDFLKEPVEDIYSLADGKPFHDEG